MNELHFYELHLFNLPKKEREEESMEQKKFWSI